MYKNTHAAVLELSGGTTVQIAEVEDHYENMSVQYAAISKSGKMIIFR